MKRFLIQVTTNWCGMDQEYVAIANDSMELDSLAASLAYDNFSDFDLHTTILEDEYPDVDEYTDEMHSHVDSIKGDYYGYTIEEWDETRPEEEWEWYNLVYDSSNGMYEFPKIKENE